MCHLGCTVTVPCHRRALDKIREDVDAFVFEGWWVFLWPLPLSQDETTPPSEATTPCCYVESRLTAFPPFMVGVPELFLERCFSSISCSDGSLYIQTVAEGQRQGRKWKKRRGEEVNNGEQIEKMDVETDTRSGGKLEGQLDQAEKDKMGIKIKTALYY